MRAFDRRRHDTGILDGVRGLALLANQQENLQGKCDILVEFASTQGGTCVYRQDLFAATFVATVNYSTAHLPCLESHDWVGIQRTRSLLHVTAPCTPEVHASEVGKRT